jgi:YggT family protein
VAFILHLAVELYSLVILAAVAASWVAPTSRHPAKLLLERATEPVLGRIRRILPTMSGIDLSPMVALLVLHVLSRVI